MTHLRIEQNTVTENVTSNIIHKLYETAKAIIDVEEANNVQESQVSLKGNLQVSKAYGDEIDWLEAKFPDLHITAGTRYIRFADPEVLRVLLANNIGDGTGVTEADASAVTYIDGLFQGNTTVTSFNELRYFTGGVQLLNRAFYNTSNLQSIDLSTVSFLSERCFSSSGITGVINLPNITRMQPLAFDNCKNITEINFGPLLTSMANSTCSGCSNLQKVTGLSNKTTVPDGMFSNCQKLSNIDIDFSKVTSIGGAAFQNCKLLTNLDLSDVVSIGNGAFNGCIGLTTVDISSCTSLGSTVFGGCTNLTSVTLPNTAIAINYDTFRDCSKLVSIDLSNVTSIGGSAFQNCASLTSVDLSNCSSINNKAFNGCTSLTSADLSSCTSIGEWSFQNCTSLTNVDLSSCTSIGNKAFNGCTGLASITDLSNCTTLGRGTFGECSNLDITNWDLSNVTKIGTTCFWGCSKLKGTLNLSGVTTFDGLIQQLFTGCSGLQKIVIGHLPLALGSNRANPNRSPFYNCTSLKVVDINQLDGLFFSNNPIFKNTPAFEALIIRNTSQIPAITYDDYTSQALWSTFAESSTPKIYVDDNLYSTYINHADWSDLASHIEPLSNYVES